jgi:magnesium-protoporphyrin O-methyltransferase
VVAVDLSPTLIELARERLPSTSAGTHRFRVGDMAAPELGEFDHVVAMDSLIHYDVADGIRVLADLADRVSGSIVFTHAPSTLLLEIMHAVGKLFPRGDRSPAIQPVSNTRLQKLMAAEPQLRDWHTGRARSASAAASTSRRPAN